MRNKVQLITYPDSLGENLKELDFVLEKYFPNLFGGVHILPFYPSSDDRGFAPLTHLEVASHFGSWKDIRRLGKKYDLMADLIVNHISTESFFFQDYLEKGEQSKYANYFISSEKFSRRIFPKRKRTSQFLSFIENIINAWRRRDKIFHLTGINKLYLKKIYRPRFESPLVKFKFKNRQEKYLWCTFTKSQVDLDVNNHQVKKILKSYIVKLAQNKINIIRLDAVGYVIKKRGTPSFLLPETKDFIRWISRICRQKNIIPLPEVHNHYSCQLDLAKISGVDYVYDFQLPLLVLHAIYEKNSRNLKNWLTIRPEKTFTTLDTHDGLPIVDTEDLLSKNEIKETSKKIIRNGGTATKRASGENGAQNVDIYQINCTYYSALNENDDAYIVARAIQFFIPGIPQIYYVGLLAGKNDLEKFKKTNVGRDLNRHNYSIPEIEKEISQPVIKRLFKLIRFRNSYPIFDGQFGFEKNSPNHILELHWKKGKLSLNVEIDLKNQKATAKYIDIKTKKEKEVHF